jgi:hypothetical protein
MPKGSYAGWRFGRCRGVNRGGLNVVDRGVVAPPSPLAVLFRCKNLDRLDFDDVAMGDESLLDFERVGTDDDVEDELVVYLELTVAAVASSPKVPTETSSDAPPIVDAEAAVPDTDVPLPCDAAVRRW